MSKKRTYGFLTTNSNIVEGKGTTVLSAYHDAQKNHKMLMEKYKDK